MTQSILEYFYHFRKKPHTFQPSPATPPLHSALGKHLSTLHSYSGHFIRLESYSMIPVFCDWLHSFHIIFSRFTYVVARISTLFLLMAELHHVVCMYHILSIHQLMNIALFPLLGSCELRRGRASLLNSNANLPQKHPHRPTQQ